MKHFRTQVLNFKQWNLSGVWMKTFACVALLSAAPQASFATRNANAEITSPMSGTVAISGNLRFCAGGNTQLSADISGFTGTPSYAWRRNGVNMPGATTATITVDNPGLYTVTVSAGGQTVTSAQVQVRVFRLQTLVQNACPGSTGNVNLVLLDNLGTNSQITYNWSNGFNGQDLMGVVSGIYTVTATDINGCVASTIANVKNTIVNVSAGSNVNICAGGSVQLNATGADNYKWSPATGLSNDFTANPTASPSTTTTYTLTGYVNSGDLVTNGDFNKRNTGFYSDYAYVNSFAVGGYSSGTGLYPEGKYGVVPNRSDSNVTKFHPAFFGVGHNRGQAAGENDDYYMAVNGSSTQGQIVWQQTVEVLPNTSYNFTTWIASINLGNLSRLRFKINSDVLGNQIVAPNALNTWNQFFTTWNSGSNTVATISIINDNLVLSGNDFGLDDISFSVACLATSQVTVNVLPAITGNTITCPAVTTFCNSGDPGIIVGSVPSGSIGTFTYQWQISDDNVTFSDIVGATERDFNPGVVNANTWFRRIVRSGDCSSTSPVCSISITGQTSISNNTITTPSPAAFCASGNPAVINGSLPTGGGAGDFSFMWESSTDGNNWNEIGGATAQSYDPGTLSQTTSFRRIARKGNCLSATSNAVTITINNAPAITIPALTERCGAGSLTLEANASGTIRWFAAATGGSALFTGSVYTVNVNATTSYFVEASVNGCTSARTAVFATVNGAPSVTSTTPGFVCGTGNATVSATASAGTLNWFADAAGLLSIGSGNSISVPASGNSTVYVGAEANGCNSGLSPVAITIGENTSSSVNEIACNSYTWALNGQTYTTGGTYTHQSLNASGCTHTTTLNLTINTSGSETINATINEGETYPFFGQTLTTAGTYTNNGTGSNGCPFVTTLVLTVQEDNDNENPIPCGTNLIVNGGFEAGNSGFNTGYTFKTDVTGNSEMIPENTYGVDASVAPYHPLLVGVGRSGKFLMVNGNTQTIKSVWSQNVNVSAGKEYEFKAYVQNIFSASPAVLRFYAGTDLIGTYSPTGIATYGEFAVNYSATATGSIELKIIDANLTAYGNDFGIDDISFTEICTQEPPSCSATEIVSFNQGTIQDLVSPVAADRSIQSNALGAPQNNDASTSPANYNFLTLGFKGEIVLKFGYPVKNGPGDDVFVVETTFGLSANNCTTYPERIRAFASQDGCNWVYMGEGCQDSYFDFQNLEWAQYVKLIDISPELSFTGGGDGYDLDGIICLHGEETNPVPAIIPVGATSVVSYVPGARKNGTPIVNNRTFANKALGAPQNTADINFVSLGFGGKLTVKFPFVIFDNPAANDLSVTETSFGNPTCAAYPERATFEGSLDGISWVNIGELCLDGQLNIGAAGAIQYLRISDISAPNDFGGSADGYDVDGIVVINSLCAPTSSARYADDVTTPNEVVGVEVYPNPFTDETIVSITTGDLDNTATVVVNNFLGQVVRSERVNVSSSSVINHYMNFSGLKPGVYFITVETNTSREVVKVVK